MSTALCWRLPRGRLTVRGKDARAFLHRMSTQHTEAMQPGSGCLNVFTNRQGRIVDVVHQAQVSVDEIVLLSSRSDTTHLQSWLEGFLFVEKVELHDDSDEGTLVLLAGPTAAQQVADWLQRPGSAGSPGTGSAKAGASGVASVSVPHAPFHASIHGDRIAWRTFSLPCSPQDARAASESKSESNTWPAYWLWDRGPEHASLLDRLQAGGAEVGTLEGYVRLRIAAGIPAFPGEMNDRFNPLELALHDALHWQKGCYIGQEVIARIDNYGKQTRHLAGVVGEHAATPGYAVGDAVCAAAADGSWQPIGEITSAAPGAPSSGVVALAMVKWKGELAGLPIRVRTATGEAAATLVPRDAAQSPHD